MSLNSRRVRCHKCVSLLPQVMWQLNILFYCTEDVRAVVVKENSIHLKTQQGTQSCEHE